MQNLHLVGFTKDRKHLIFSTRRGAKSGSFLVPVDDDLVEAVDEVANFAEPAEEGTEAVVQGRTPAPPRVESQLSVREVQARLRAGEAISAVATDAGVDPEWVERFAQPVRAEQRRVVERAMAARLERPRAGESAVPLRTAVAASMVERDVPMTADQFDSAWSAHLLGSGEWLVGFTFKSRGGRRTLNWQFTPSTGQLTSKDRFATQLGFRSPDDPLPSAEALFGAEPSPESGSKATRRSSGGLAYPGTTPTASSTVNSPTITGPRPARATSSLSSPTAAWDPAPRPRPPQEAPDVAPAGRRSSGSGQDRGHAPIASPPQVRPAMRGDAAPSGPPRPVDRPRPAAGGDRPPPGRDVVLPTPVPPRTPRPTAPPAGGPSFRQLAPPSEAAGEPSTVSEGRPTSPIARRTPAPVVADAGPADDEDIPSSLRLVATDDDSSIRVVPTTGADVDDAVGVDPVDDADEDDPVEDVTIDGDDVDVDDDDDGDDGHDDDNVLLTQAEGQPSEDPDDHVQRGRVGEGRDQRGDDDHDDESDDDVDAMAATDEAPDPSSTRSDAGTRRQTRLGRVRFATDEERTRTSVDRAQAEPAEGGRPSDRDPSDARGAEAGSVDVADHDDDLESDGTIEWSDAEPERRRLKPLGEEDIKPSAERTRRRSPLRQDASRRESSAKIRAGQASAVADDGSDDAAPSDKDQTPGSGEPKRRRRREPLRAR